MMKAVFNGRLLIGVTLATMIGALLLDPIPQPLSYHDFADQRTFADIPNLLDVLSNLPFLAVGVVGLILLAAGKLHADAGLRPAIALFFLGVTLTAFGSAYYHLRPDNASLFWDRLPMTLAFMGLFSLVIGEYIKVDLGRLLLWPLLLIGIGSVLWWEYTERLGVGDLRLYGLVQFLPMLLLPLILLSYPAHWSRGRDYWIVGGWYLAAKLLEYFDRSVFAVTGGISGHTLKHLAAAMAAWQVLSMLRRRVKLQSSHAGHLPSGKRA
jgi:hypothetical protein